MNAFAGGFILGILLMMGVLSAVGYSPGGVSTRAATWICQQQGATDGKWLWRDGKVICRTETYSEVK